MRNELVKVKEITTATLSNIIIFDVSAMTFYESVNELFQCNKKAKASFSTLLRQEYTVEELFDYTLEAQAKIIQQLWTDTLNQLIADKIIICYTGLEMLN